MVYVIIKGQREEKELEESRRMAKIEAIESRKGKNRDKNAGYSTPGYNFGLGTYIKDKEHYKKVLREKQAESPDFQEAG